MRAHTTIATALTLALIVGAASARAQAERKCPDGGPAYFGVCPNDKPAANQLQRQLEQLANFPKDVPPKQVASQLEVILRATTGRQLYDIVSPYDKSSLQSVPDIGVELFEYRKAYYAYRQQQLEFQDRQLSRIGAIATQHVPDAWKVYLNYIFLRQFGRDPESIKKAGEVFAFGFSWSEAEPMFQTLSKEPDTAASFVRLVNEHTRLDAMAEKLLQRYR